MTPGEGEREVIEERSTPRRAWVYWLVCSLALLAISATFIGMAPAGAWPNEIHGRAAWMESDPGSIYVASAHEFAWGESPLFLGHPGATLTPLLRGVQSALYLLSGETERSFTRFTAQNLRSVFFASKLMMTFLHLLSFVALYALAKRLLEDRAAATVATLAYATSFPILYYVSRISVEPLMVMFFALSFVAVWRYQDEAVQDHLPRACGFAALAGLASVSGAVTKLNFLGPLPFFLALYMLAGGLFRGSATAIELRTRGIALLAFLGAGGAAITLYSQIIDWEIFVSFWRRVAQKRLAVRWEFGDFLPGLDSHHIILGAELLFFIVGALSWVAYLRRAKDLDRGLWFSGYLLYALLLFSYRISVEGNFLPFHYFILSQAALAVFFGWGTVQAARKIGAPISGYAATAALIAWLGLHHGIGAFVAAESRLHDAAMYKRRRPAFALLVALAPNERIGVAFSSGTPAGLERRLHTLHGMVFPVPWDPRPSRLRQEILHLFEPVPPASIAAIPGRTFVPSLAAEVAILPAAESPTR